MCHKAFSSVEDNVWLYLQDLEVARSFAAADIVDGCLVVTGGDTELGPTDSVEIIRGMETLMTHDTHITHVMTHMTLTLLVTQVRAAPGPMVTCH